MHERRFHTYIMSNQWNTVLYVGMTGNLEGRVCQHKRQEKESFTKRYYVNKLVYYEEFDSPSEAIYREKQIKKYRRDKKDALIASMNPKWEDLAKDWDCFSTLLSSRHFESPTPPAGGRRGEKSP